MIVLYGVVFFLYFLLFLLSFQRKLSLNRQDVKNDKKNNAEKQAGQKKSKGILEGMADYLYGICTKRKILHQQRINDRLHILYPEIGEKKEKEKSYLREFYINKIRLALLLVLAGNVTATCFFAISRLESVLKEGKYINRNTYGMGSKEMDLQVRIEGEQGGHRENFAITVEEQKYEEALARQMAEEISRLLPDLIRGANTSLEEVRSGLNMIHKIEGYPFRIDWESDNYTLIDPDGNVAGEAAKKEGDIVYLTAVLTYDKYREEFIFPVCVFPPEYSEEELWKKRVYEILAHQEEKDRYSDKVELPDSIEGQKLIWSRRIEDSSGYIFLFMCISAGMVYLLQDEKLKEKMEQRNREMLLDYPQLLSRLMLYLGAGMTLRNAFQRIAYQYDAKKQQGEECRYVYEEMLLTCHELDSGIPEATAYEHFGKRCRLPQYTKLSNILIQDLKKGSGSIVNMLRQEIRNAFEERKNMARKLGEEAGTKLLLPMMLMLGVVMVLIIVPAYFSFSV